MKIGRNDPCRMVYNVMAQFIFGRWIVWILFQKKVYCHWVTTMYMG